MTGKAKVIAFANQKGGVAKTTTTLNLAAAFVEEGHRVLCVDMDPQGNLTMSQGIDPDSLELSMFDVLVHDLPIQDVVRTPRGGRRVRVDRPCRAPRSPCPPRSAGSARWPRRCGRSGPITTSSASIRRRRWDY